LNLVFIYLLLKVIKNSNARPQVSYLDKRKKPKRSRYTTLKKNIKRNQASGLGPFFVL